MLFLARHVLALAFLAVAGAVAHPCHAAPCQTQASSAQTPARFSWFFGQPLDGPCVPGSGTIHVTPGGAGASVTGRFRAFDGAGQPDFGVPPLGAYETVVTAAGTVVFDWGRPLVTDEATGVAESRTRFGLEGQVNGFGAPAALGYEPAGSLTPTVWSGAPPAGGSPVVAHTIEPASVAPGTKVLQQALDYAGTLPLGALSTYEVVQRFQVPQSCSAKWVELSLVEVPLSGAMSVAIYPAGSPEPPFAVPGGAAVTSLQAPPGGLPAAAYAAFAATAEFASPVALAAGTDYFLHVTTANEWDFSTATTNPLGGHMYHRDASTTNSWATESALDLTFRLIGTTGATTGVAGPGRVTPERLGVSASPNPARGATTLRWSGATGPATVAVFDLSGRELRTMSVPGATAAGGWTWDGKDTAGRALPAGVYLVRVVDGAARQGVTRVFLQR